MKSHLRTPLSIIVSALLLSACASGKGGFELDSVNSLNTQGASQNPTATTPKAPTYQDEAGTRRTLEVDNQEPALGYVLSQIPYRNTSVRPLNPTPDVVNIDPTKITAINQPLSAFPKVYGDLIEEHTKYNDEGIYYSHDGRRLSNNRPLQYVRSGYVIGERGIEFVREKGKREFDIIPQGQYGYVFYQGVNPATHLPAQKATYTGTWDFVSNASKERRELAEGFTQENIADTSIPGNTTGATSLQANVNNRISGKPIGQSSVFEVDFANKTLTGTLTSNGYVSDANAEQEITDRYSIDAKLKGNRFVGTANAKNKEHGIFGKDGVLEGGFFGDNAEELAGKFLAEDNSLFGVFAGKRGELDKDKIEAKFDATAIDSETLEKSKMDTFGQVSHLVIGGKRLALLPDGVNSFADMAFNHTRQVEHDGKKLSVSVCCNNLDYVKFGSYGKVGGTQDTPTLSDGKMFLVGERTALSEMPTGKAHYRGTWEGRIDSKSGPRWAESASNLNTGARSIFEVDFGANSLTGKLIGNDGLESHPILTLNGTIVGNGFSGTAKTREGGFNIDPKSTGASAIANINANFSGGFYGANASELGGVIHHDKAGEDKIAVVFGAKRQTSTP